MYLELTESLEQALPKDIDVFAYFLNGEGEIHRHVKNRLTYETQIGPHHVFIKRHLGSGWPAVLKEWYRFRKPIYSARTEWDAAEKLAAVGLRVPTVLGKGERGKAPNAVESFVVLEALEDCETLEYFREGWLDFRDKSWVQLKRAMIKEVASMAHTMHQHGINHCDFYLNHFLINRDVAKQWTPGKVLPLHLIDLHRVQQRRTVPERWLIKDLAALLFSALDVGLSSADYIRFLKVYVGPNWKTSLHMNAPFWKMTTQRAIKLYTNFHNKAPTLPALLKH
ncbi:MAG: lipopolysaccharide core heptose(I) kinase RfaP [Opitutaceae bacterium]